jgi:hypothetical protein
MSMIDLWREGTWESKGTYMFYLEMYADLMHLFVYSIFFTVIFANYGLPLHLVSCPAVSQLLLAGLGQKALLGPRPLSEADELILLQELESLCHCFVFVLPAWIFMMPSCIFARLTRILSL